MTRSDEALRPARLRLSDTARTGVTGLRTRPLRVFLSALGIAIGIAAMLSVIGISSSSRAELDRVLDQLGTNLLTVAPGTTFLGDPSSLPAEAVIMVQRIGPVRSASAVGRVTDTSVYRNEHIPRGQSGGIAVMAATPGLLDTVGGRMARGNWLNPATAAYPAVVLGSTTSTRLGVSAPGTRVWLGGQWFSVAGVLDSAPLAPELDTAALVGWAAAGTYLSFDGHPTMLYTRAEPNAVEAVRAVLGPTANPAHPEEVKVSRPSDALIAQRAGDSAFDGLLLGLGAVALLVGGIGVANTMVVSVLERRSEIGLRRSLGATRGQVRTQFLAESLLLSALGGLGGVLVGGAVTVAYATSRDWPSAMPAWAIVGGVTATLAIGSIAGLYPAIRAARLDPTEALATP